MKNITVWKTKMYFKLKGGCTTTNRMIQDCFNVSSNFDSAVNNEYWKLIKYAYHKGFLLPKQSSLILNEYPQHLI